MKTSAPILGLALESSEEGFMLAGLLCVILVTLLPATWEQWMPLVQPARISISIPCARPVPLPEGMQARPFFGVTPR